MSLTFERLYPLIFGCSLGLLSWLLDMNLPSDEGRFTALLSASISVSAILVGFLATMKSILMALPGVIDRLRAANYLDILSNYLFEGTLANFVFCLFNIACFFLPLSSKAFDVISALWIALGVASALSFWRVTKLMLLVMKMTPPPSQGGTPP